MKRILLTGFTMFSPYRANSTAQLLDQVEGREVAGYFVRTALFQASMELVNPMRPFTEELFGYVEVLEPSAVVSLGMSSSARGLRVEGRCHNWIENDKYPGWYDNFRHIDPKRPTKEVLCTDLAPWRIPQMQEGLRRRGLPFEGEVSKDAGGFCSNAFMYLTLREMEIRNWKFPFLFAHVPCSEEAVAGMTAEEFDRQSHTILKDGELLKMLEVILQNFNEAG